MPTMPPINAPLPIGSVAPNCAVTVVPAEAFVDDRIDVTTVDVSVGISIVD